MKILHRSKRFYLYFLAITLFIAADIFIFTALAPSKQLNANDLNNNITRSRPVYSTKYSKSFASLRSGYYFELELTHPKKLNPAPRNISDKRFIGYAAANSRLNVYLHREDQSKNGAQKRVKQVASWPLTRGKKELIIPGEGDFSKHQFRINLFVKEEDLDIKVAHNGILWNTYSPAKAYHVNLDVTRLRVIHVTPHGLSTG